MVRLLSALFACAVLTGGVGAQTLDPGVVTAPSDRTFTTTDLGPGPLPTRLNERTELLLPQGDSTFFWSPATGFVDLGGIDEFPPVTHGRDLNDCGQIVGDFRGVNGNLAPFLWSLAAGFKDLSGSTGPEAPAHAVNNATEVTGGDLMSSGAFRWAPAAGMNAVRALNGCCGSAGFAINRWGDIAGASSFPGGGEEGYHAFVWKGTTFVDIGDLGGPRSAAESINNVGQVAGWSITGAPTSTFWPAPLHLRRAFFWTERDGIMDIGTLGGAWSTPTAMNDFGEVVGLSETPAGAAHGFHWTRERGMTDLGPGTPTAMNNMGQVSGDIVIDGQLHAVVWTSTGRVVLDPNATARDINHQGQIAGGTVGPGSHVLLWQIPITFAERIRFFEARLLANRYGGVMTTGTSAAARAALRQAKKFAAEGKTKQAERALRRAANFLARVEATGGH
jgi:probable HAF family extracellular repeat protein